jgi:peptidoglycan/xylan/chitin deacetylase (PgdA/CDA1 family)
LGWRRRLAHALTGSPAKPVILMYHRVATPASDPWDLAVGPERFEAQMELLRRRRTPLPLAEFVARLEANDLPRDAVAVTFDDGYADNLTVAKPRLEAHGVPATVYLVSESIGSDREFWWDELARLILDRRAPLHGTLQLSAEQRIGLVVEDAAAAEGPWRGWEPPRNARERTFVEVWSRLRDMDPGARAAAMDGLRILCAAAPADQADLPMTAAQVRDLVSGGLIAAGAHTRTHAHLPSLPDAAQRHEIAGSRTACEALAQQAVTQFAYPYGEYDARAEAVVRDAGFDCAVTTHEGPVRPGRTNPFALPRLQVLDWDVDAFDAALRMA